MSIWITARARSARSGRALKSAIVPSISGGQTKRMVRRGGASFPSRTSFASVRAVSRIAEQPLALSFAPGRWWSRWQESTISCVRSWPGPTPGIMRGGNAVDPGVLPGLDARPQPHRPARREPRLPGPRLLERHHEGERLRLRESVEMPPADEVLVLLPPPRHLVLGVGDDPRRAEAVHGQLVDRSPLGRGEDELALDVLARVVRLRRPGPGIHQLGRDLTARAVLGQHDGTGLPGGDPLGVHPPAILLPLLPQLGEVSVPGGPGALGAVEALAIRRQLQDLGLREPVLLRPVAHPLGSGTEPPRAPHAVEQRQVLEVALCRRARHLGGDGAHRRLRQQRRRLGAPGRSCRSDPDEQNRACRAAAAAGHETVSGLPCPLSRRAAVMSLKLASISFRWMSAVRRRNGRSSSPRFTSSRALLMAM